MLPFSAPNTARERLVQKKNNNIVGLPLNEGGFVSAMQAHEHHNPQRQEIESFMDEDIDSARERLDRITEG